MQRLGLGVGEPAFGGDQPQAFDHLVDVAFEDPLGALVDERLGLGAALAVQRVGDLPELV